MADGVRSDGYYRRFPGDYQRDTKGLSLAEHGAYSQLLDSYYSEEELPSDPTRLYRIAGAMDDQERRAVDKVVKKYFMVDGDRLIQERVERELAARRTFLATRGAFLEEQARKAKLGANARWKAPDDAHGDARTMPVGMPPGMPGRCPDDAPASAFASRSGSRSGSKDLHPHPSTASKKPSAVAQWENGLLRVREVLEELQVLETDLNDPAYWKRLNAWAESSGQKIYILDDLRAYVAWWAVQTGAKRHKKLAKGFRNWLAAAIRRKENDALREASRNTSRK